MKKTLLSSGMAAVFMLLSAVTAFADNTDAISIQSETTDYTDPENWAFWNYGEDKDADLFIVCPTVDMGKAGNYNADISDETMKGKFDGALNMELGIYTDTAAVYSPYYRQATFPVYSLDKAECDRYLQIAYDDVRDAFLYYSENCDESRPLILAGFSQGSDMIIRLMTEFFDDKKYSDRLVAAYAVGWSLTEEQAAQYPWLKPAQSENDTGVIVMFNSEAEHITSSLMVGENKHTYSINPLNWKTDSTPADKSLNKGACFTDYDGNITSEIPELTGAYIDGKRGTLKVPDISEADYPAAIFDEGIFHIYDYQFFYRNLQENVALRTGTYLSSCDGDPIPEYDMVLTASADVEECYIGNEFVVSITIENTGTGDLTDLSVLFEDIEIYSAETLEAGKSIEFQIKLKAWEEDIAKGGIIHLSTSADEIPEAVKTVCTVKVLRTEQESAETETSAEPNPETGAELPALAVLAVSAAAMLFSLSSTSRHS